MIYALVDEFGTPRYVGQTQKRLSTRLAQHRSAAFTGRWNRPLDQWLRECPQASIIPLEITTPDKDDESERRWIKQMRDGGVPLLNIRDGVGHGIPHTAEARAKISAARKGKPLSEAHRRKLSDAHTGIVLGDEHRAAIGRGGKGRIFSETHRERLSASKKGSLNPMSAARRAKRLAEGGGAR